MSVVVRCPVGVKARVVSMITADDIAAHSLVVVGFWRGGGCFVAGAGELVFRGDGP